MIYTIITKENPNLRKRTEKVNVENITKPEMQKLIDDMIETMYSSKGIGLAAPQIDILKRIIIAEEEDKKPVALFNPEIVSKSWRKVLSEEGCLSVPGVYGIVRRHKSVHVKAYDRYGEPVDIKTDGMFAIILQHEIDHINGILFIDKAEKVQQIHADENVKI